MAFYPIPKRPEDEEQAQDTGVPAPQPGTMASSAPGGAPSNQPQKQGSGRYFDFSRYLAANAGKGARMAQGVANAAATQARGADAAFTDLETKLGASGAVPPPPTYGSVYRDAKGAATPSTGTVGAKGPITAATPFAPPARAAPVDIARHDMPVAPMGANPVEDRARAEAQRAADYSYIGPSSIRDVEGYGDAVAKGQDALSALGMLSSRSRPRPGLSALDAMLIGAEGGEVLANTQQEFSGLRKRIEDAVAKDVGAQRRDEAAGVRAAGRGVLGRLDDNAQSLMDAETENIESADADAREFDDLNTWVGSVQSIMPALVNRYGLTPPHRFESAEDAREWVRRNRDALSRARAEMG